METKNPEFNQDEDCDDFALPWEPDKPIEQTEDRFIASHGELTVLVKYWFMDLLESRWLFDFVCPQYGRDIQERRNYASRRIARIRRMVGDERLDSACAEVRNEFSQRINADLWAVFEHGNEAQRDVVADEMNSVLTGNTKRWSSFTYRSVPESVSLHRTKRFSLSLTPKEWADLEAASRRLAKSPRQRYFAKAPHCTFELKGQKEIDL